MRAMTGPLCQPSPSCASPPSLTCRHYFFSCPNFFFPDAAALITSDPPALILASALNSRALPARGMRPAAACGDRAAGYRRGPNAPPAAAATTTTRVMVRTLRGELVALDVDGAATVARLKGMVMAREGVAADAQRLFFAGRHLDDDALPLAHYGVRHGSVVFLSLRLRAGEEAGASQYVLVVIAHCSETQPANHLAIWVVMHV